MVKFAPWEFCCENSGLVCLMVRLFLGPLPVSFSQSSRLSSVKAVHSLNTLMFPRRNYSILTHCQWSQWSCQCFRSHVCYVHASAAVAVLPAKHGSKAKCHGPALVPPAQLKSYTTDWHNRRMLCHARERAVPRRDHGQTGRRSQSQLRFAS